MSKSLRWRRVGTVQELLRTHWQDGREMPYPVFTGYTIESRWCVETRKPIVVLIYPEGGTGQFHSITEAKAEAEKEAER